MFPWSCCGKSPYDLVCFLALCLRWGLGAVDIWIGPTHQKAPIKRPFRVCCLYCPMTNDTTPLPHLCSRRSWRFCRPRVFSFPSYPVTMLVVAPINPRSGSPCKAGIEHWGSHCRSFRDRGFELTLCGLAVTVVPGPFRDGGGLVFHYLGLVAIGCS